MQLMIKNVVNNVDFDVTNMKAIHEATSIYTERQNSCTTFSFDFFLIKIDDFKIVVPVQKTIVAEKIKCV